LDRVVPHAKAVLLASPQGGEGQHLSLSQKSDLLNKTMVAMGGRVPIFVWVTQDTTPATLETVRTLQGRVEKRSYEGPVYWVDTPLYHHSNRGLPNHYRKLCRTHGTRVIVHNDPTLVGSLGKSLKRNNIRTAILKELAGLESLAGLIFTGSLERFHNYQKACRFRDRFRIYDGDEETFLDHPSAAGVVSAGANLAPQAWQKVTRAALRLDADQQEYPDHQQQVWKWGEFLHQLRSTYAGRAAGVIKGVLWDMGILETPTCAYSVTDSRASERAAALMQHYGEYL